MEKTHAGSSFESASSLYSNKEMLSEELLQHDDKTLKTKLEKSKLSSPITSSEMIRKSPSHSVSSTSSGSYNMSGFKTKSADKEKEIVYAQIVPQSVESSKLSDKPKPKSLSVSDDDRSEVRYSSSGYYESPHDEEANNLKARRLKQEEDRKRRKTSMKLNIEKENMRALTSPIKKPAAIAATTPTALLTKEVSPEQPGSPNKIKRFRPKVRRQFRRSSRDDSTPRRVNKPVPPIYGIPLAVSAEKLLDCSLSAVKTEEKQDITPKTVASSPPPLTPLSASLAVTNVTTKSKPHTVASKSTSELCQLKTKSVESLRSVSPGSDSVFYSEADGSKIALDPHNHCLHCGKEMEGLTNPNSVQSGLGDDSVESLPFIENEADIVKPPSDFADSPVTTKTTQRLYKKMDKRFRSEERYHGERGRHYKSRQENIRAKVKVERH